MTRRNFVKIIAGACYAFLSLNSLAATEEKEKEKKTAKAKNIWQPPAEPIAEPARLTSLNTAKKSK
ncbi:MAG: hypothetical protein JXR46_02835 [Calditrichaceae bacterium]|nr:hypothetical protein [Calditrichaceae bacterium]MBN2707959.1 hypothetical protein [Calditrichaceae bacterium]RQV95940.1 MAG: hypothetical protein EH224_06120 [Calditrichota bacterium]